MPNQRSLQQFSALLWKNWKIKYRSKGSIFFELVFPLLIASMVMYVQSKGKTVIEKPAVRFEQEWTFFLYEDFQLVLFYTPVSRALEQMLKVDEGRTFPAGKSYPTVAEAIMGHDASLELHLKSPIVSFQMEDVNTVPKNLKFKVNIDSKYDADKMYGNSLDLTVNDIPRVMLGVTQIFINYWQKQNGVPMSKIDLVFNRMPTLPTKESENNISFLTGEYLLTFLPLFCFAAITLVEEREKKIKESMKLMGLGELIYWMSWFVMNFIYGLYLSIVMLVVVCLDYSQIGTLIKSSCPLFFIFELLIVTNTITAAFLMSTIIKRGRIIGILSVIVYFGVKIGADNFLKLKLARMFTYMIGVFVYGFGFRMALLVLHDKESAGRPVYFSTMAINENDPHKTFLDGILIMIMNTMFNVFFVWYLSNVFPGEFGTPKPCNFLFTMDS
ncbi:cholesterol transporter ABCA5-like [Physella acuta]|uniref:cholesterol transporter ABCA5-like n=1 Tax=Physella acuta TaxID=109671 RepID=UPI0027DC1678|nr:cholesterol transporter ABCA5-like [Physella acuta]